MRWVWPVALAASAATGALLLAAAVLAAVTPNGTTIGITAVGGCAAALWASVGLAVARRPSGQRVGVLLTLVGALLAYSAARLVLWHVLGAHPVTAGRLSRLVALVAESSIWLFVALALLLLCFPDGRLPGPRWRPVPALLVVAALVHHAYGAVDRAAYSPPLQHLAHPFGRPPLAVGAVATVFEPILLALFIACAASLVIRYRRADALRRRQLKWLALAGLGVPGFIVVCLTEVVVFGAAGRVSAAVGLASAFGIPLAIAVAMLRADLYDVDRALANAVGYGLASAVVLAMFACAAFAAGVVLGHGSAVAAAAATALGAVALSPLRRRLQRRVDRRLYPVRDAALSAVAALQRDIDAGRARPEQLGDRLRAALRDPGLRVGYRIPGSAGLVDDAGTPLELASAVDVVLDGAPIGALAPSLPGLGPELLREVAAASTTLVEVVRLRLELSGALKEVEASRERLVHAGDEERRRLERDLHDGAQQRLVSLGMALRVAQRRLGAGDAELDRLFDRSVAELATAVAELREIAHGLRPSSLDDGLHASLTALTQHLPIPIGLDVHAEPLPDEVATTAYYVASEAIANAVKHARATRIDVRIARCDGRLEVQVSDDGRGGATLAPGSGLAGLSDRVEAIGGALALRTEAGRGTTVEATVPCES